MTRIRRLFQGQGIACLGIAVFVVCALWVFFPVIPKFAALLSPDSGPYFAFAHRTRVLEGLLTGSAFTPHALYWLLFNPLYAHELTYIIDSFVLALAGVYYLTGRRVHPLAAWAGGLALGLSGYTFTLFCAGHRGYFHMFSCAVWAFGLLIRCFETRKLFYFAMLGLIFAWGVPVQPDVLVLVGAVAAAYALWLTFQCRGQKEGLGRFWGNVFSVWPRFIVSVLVLLLAGFGGLRSAVTTQMSSRDAQIAGVSEQDFKADKKPEKQSEAAKHDRWLFATNWSLPPEDMLEFIAPGVFGNESMQMPYPYWGRLGRPSDEVFQKGRMMPNYRQHTVYLGVVSVLFALFGVVAWFSCRKKLSSCLCVSARDKSATDCRPSTATAPPGLRSLASDLRSPNADTSDVPFWCGVWVVCLILAMGRYTPVYRLFYSIPYMDYIRAPVKFHHLVEVATAFLAGFGMDAFMRASPVASALRRKLVGLAGGMAGIFVLGAGLMLANKADVVSYIGSLGMGQAAEVLGGYAVQNLMRSVCLAALVAGLAYAAYKGGERTLVRVGCVLLALLALEQAWVASRYVKVINVEPFYHENAVVKAIKKVSAGQVVNVVDYVTPNVWAQDWFSTSLGMNGINNMAPSPDERGTSYERLFTALQKDPLRLWRALNVQFVIVPRKGTEGLMRSGVLRPVFDFELGSGVLRQVQPSDQSVVLAAVAGSSPGARTVTRWKGGIAPERQAEALAGSVAVVSQAPEAINGSEAVGEAKLDYKSVWGFPLCFATRLTCVSSSPVLILFNQRMDMAWEVLVDGAVVPCYLSDGLWLSAVVPQGTHRVVLRKKRDVAPGALSFMVTLALLVWGVWSCAAGRHPHEVSA